jgi:hypothetical protein
MPDQMAYCELKVRSQPERVSIGQALKVLGAQGIDGLGTIEPDVFVELAGQDGLEVMALQAWHRALA